MRNKDRSTPSPATAMSHAAADTLMPGELPRHGEALPEAPPRSIVKLDARSMVWGYDEVASDVEALSPFMALALLFGLAFLVPMTILGFFEKNEPLSGQIIAGVMSALLIPAGIIGIVYLLKISLFSRYAQLHFNRKTGGVYTRQNKLAVRLDWSRVRPFVAAVPGPLAGGTTLAWALVLVEFNAGAPLREAQRIGVQGLLPDRAACQRLWEFIRRYMEDPPEQMPEVELVPGGRTWQGALVDFGPMREPGPIDAFSDLSLSVAQRLRRENWWPIIDPLRMLWWIMFWPGPLSTILYERFRREATLPAEWIADETPIAGEDNPYRSRDRALEERAGRRKAAWVIGIVSSICIVLGASGWAFAFHVAFQSFLVEIWGELFHKMF